MYQSPNEGFEEFLYSDFVLNTLPAFISSFISLNTTVGKENIFLPIRFPECSNDKIALSCKAAFDICKVINIYSYNLLQSL